MASITFSNPDFLISRPYTLQNVQTKDCITQFHLHKSENVQSIFKPTSVFFKSWHFIQTMASIQSELASAYKYLPF